MINLRYMPRSGITIFPYNIQVLCPEHVTFNISSRNINIKDRCFEKQPTNARSAEFNLSLQHLFKRASIWGRQ